MSAAAVKAHGRDEALKAYALTVKVLGTESYAPERMHQTSEETTAEDLASVKKYMTADAARDWDRNVASRTSPESLGNVYGMTFFGANGKGWQLRSDVPAVPEVKISDSRVGLAKDGERLIVTVDSDATIRYVTPEGAFQKMDMAKTVTLYLQKGPSKDQSWLIDGWSADMRTSPLVADVK